MKELRNHAIFQAAISPDRPPWEGVRETAEAIAASLRARGWRADPVNRTPGGWCFAVQRAGLRSICSLQRADHWLLVCEARPRLLQRLLGKAARELAATLSELGAVLSGDPRFHGVHWLTHEEYERGLGDPGPGPDLEAEAETHHGEPDAEPPEDVPGLAELLRAGEALARPSLELGTERGAGAPVASWSAGYPLEPGGALVHVISVDCAWLSSQGFPLFGTISVFAERTGERCEVIQEATPLAQLLQARGGLPL